MHGAHISLLQWCWCMCLCVQTLAHLTLKCKMTTSQEIIYTYKQPCIRQVKVMYNPVYPCIPVYRIYLKDCFFHIATLLESELWCMSGVAVCRYVYMQF